MSLGFCQVKKIKKSEKNSEVGWWVKNWKFGVFLCFFCCTCFLKNIFEKLLGGWVGGVWLIEVFLEFLDFFKLDKPLVNSL